ncbi:MAG TPA: hypothetical protein HA237_00380, partial [Candidatus Diapherotrites archaeon]|nr:hypothetical protein [Candidatus Diapherotrites archaeon]
AREEIARGKTLYQKLFEYLIDGRTVSYRGLAKVLARRGFNIEKGTIRFAVLRIEEALRKSSDPALRKTMFMKKEQFGRGSGRPVSRNSSKARFTAAQKTVIEDTIEKALREGTATRGSYSILMEQCLAALKRKGLGKEVALHESSVKRALRNVLAKHPELETKRKLPLPRNRRMP